MTEKQIISLIESSLEEKINVNPDIIKYSFFELSVKYNLNEKDKQSFLKFLKIKLENNNYDVFTEGQSFEYKNQKIKVKDNELLVATRRML